MSSKDLLDLTVIDEIIEEPAGGAHRDKDKILRNLKSSISKNLENFKNFTREEVLKQRKNKFLAIGRSNGFSSQSSKNNSLIIENNFVDLIIEKSLNYKKYFLVFILAIVFVIIYLSLS